MPTYPQTRTLSLSLAGFCCLRARSLTSFDSLWIVRLKRFFFHIAFLIRFWFSSFSNSFTVLHSVSFVSFPSFIPIDQFLSLFIFALARSISASIFARFELFLSRSFKPWLDSVLKTRWCSTWLYKKTLIWNYTRRAPTLSITWCTHSVRKTSWRDSTGARIEYMANC